MNKQACEMSFVHHHFKEHASKQTRHTLLIRVPLMDLLCYCRPALKDAKASEVRWIMQHLAFRPKEAAFTTMFKACGSDVAKAFELWKAMKARPDVKPNNISYRSVSAIFLLTLQAPFRCALLGSTAYIILKCKGDC